MAEGEKIVFLKDLSEWLGVHRSYFQEKAKKDGINIIKITDPRTGRPSLAVTSQEAQHLAMNYEQSKVEYVKNLDELGI